MPATLMPEKKKGLETVANSRGVITALAIDRRDAMRALFGKAIGLASDAVPVEKLIRYKQAVSRVLTPHASAVLLDPEYGLPAARLRAKTAEYRRVAAAGTIPFIYLSQGVSNETFQYALELAAEENVNFGGVLCGRATGKDGVAVLVRDGEYALNDWLGTVGVGNIENMNLQFMAASPWHRGT